MKTFLFMLLTVVLVLTTSCSDSHNHSDDDHAEAFGFVLFDQNNKEILRNQNATPSDSIRILLDSSSTLYRVQFLNDKNELFTPTDVALSIKLTFGNGAIATETITNRWNFSLKGVSRGTTSLRISLFHNDHADYVSSPVTIVVQ